MVELVAPLEAMGLKVEPLLRRDALQLFSAWCEAFCGEVKVRTGSYRHRGLHWHAFSYELVKALGHSKALEQYSLLEPESVVAIPETWSDGFGVRFSGLPLPDLSFLHTDLYVFPESLEWTMVFTHEPEFGPYFTWRHWSRLPAN